MLENRTFLLCVTVLLLTLFSTVSSSKAGGPALPDRLHIISLLKNHQFSKLESLLSGFQKAYEQGAIAERSVATAFVSFSNSDSSLELQLNEWVESMPQSYAAHLARGYYYQHLGWLSRGSGYSRQTTDTQFQDMRNLFTHASDDFNKALSLNPKLVLAYRHLISMAMAKGDQKSVDQLYTDAIQIDPASYVLRDQYLFSLQPKWRSSVDRMMFDIHPEASQSIQKIRVVVDESLPYRRDNADLVALNGFIPYVYADETRNRNMNAATRFFNEAVYESNSHWWYLYKRGEHFYYLNEYEKALKDLTKALVVSPQDVRPLNRRGWTYYLLDQYQQALNDFDKGISLDTLNPELRHGRASTLYRLSRFDEAAADYESALVYGANVSSIWSNVGRIYLYQLKDYEKATKFFAKAVELNPGNNEECYNYSGALYYLHDCKVMQALEKYLELCENGSRCQAKRVEWAEATSRHLVSKDICEPISVWHYLRPLLDYFN